MLRTIAFAATAATLLATPVLASEYRISTENLHTAQGAQAFDTKLRQVSRQLCNGHNGYARVRCISAVRTEALSQLPKAQQLAYLKALNLHQAAPLQLATLG